MYKQAILNTIKTEAICQTLKKKARAKGQKSNKENIQKPQDNR